MTMTEPPSESTTRETGAALRIVKRVAPWAVLVIIFWLIFRSVPLELVLNEFRSLSSSQVILLTGLSLAAVAGVALLDGIAMWYGFSRLKVGISWREMVLVRSAMMLLASIATLIGQAGLAAHVARKHEVGAGAAAGMVMFLFFIEIYGMITVAAIGLPAYLWLRGGSIDPGAQVELAFLMVTLAWMGFIILILTLRSGRGSWILERLRLGALARPFQVMQPGEIIRTLALKTLLATWQVGITIPAFLIYGEWIPGPEMFAFMPLAILVSSIPITPARLGTTQASWVIFFQHLVEPQALVAFSLLFQFLLNVCRWLIGAAVLPFIHRDLIKGGKES